MRFLVGGFSHDNAQHVSVETIFLHGVGVECVCARVLFEGFFPGTFFLGHFLSPKMPPPALPVLAVGTHPIHPAQGSLRCVPREVRRHEALTHLGSWATSCSMILLNTVFDVSACSRSLSFMPTCTHALLSCLVFHRDLSLTPMPANERSQSLRGS